MARKKNKPYASRTGTVIIAEFTTETRAEFTIPESELPKKGRWASSDLCISATLQEKTSSAGKSARNEISFYGFYRGKRIGARFLTTGEEDKKGRLRFGAPSLVQYERRKPPKVLLSFLKERLPKRVAKLIP